MRKVLEFSGRRRATEVSYRHCQSDDRLAVDSLQRRTDVSESVLQVGAVRLQNLPVLAGVLRGCVGLRHHHHVRRTENASPHIGW